MPDDPKNVLLDSALQKFDAGRFAEALPLLRSAANDQPKDHRAYELAGRCLLGLGDYQAALDAFQRAISAKIDWSAPYLGAARALTGLGDAHGSMQMLLNVLSIVPGNIDATQQLVELLSRLQPDGYLSGLQPALCECFAHPDIDPGPLSRLCGQQLRLGIADLLDPRDRSLPDAVITSIADNKLWRLYLRRVINLDPELEDLLTRLRRDLCLRTSIDSGEKNLVELIAALAEQCFLNEYVFDPSDAELARLARFEDLLGAADEPSDAVAVAFALSCSYRAPELGSSIRAHAEALIAKHPWLEELCRLTVFEPLEEAKLAENMPVLRPIQDGISLAVQAQYEANPYPRWQAPPAPPKAPLLEPVRRRFSLQAATPGKTGALRVLVAGCGTGFEPIDIARRDDSVAITAVDLSRRSLAYAKRKAEALGCKNIDFHQADILDLPDTNWEFDLIVCTGVLHHMSDPLAGWKALRDMLAATGMMRLSLYSSKARRNILAAREQIAARKLTGKVDDIRGFRQWLVKESSDSDLETLRYSDDFYSMSGCRDLLFHVQEQQFTIPDIQNALDQLELRFCGFDPANASLLKAFAARNPGAEALRDLKKWDAFEQWNPDIFAGMYQFWCEHGSI